MTMDEVKVKKLGYIFLLSVSGSCFAAKIPVKAQKIDYTKNTQADLDGYQQDLPYLYLIPKKTYQYLDQAFSSFYKKLSYESTICETTLEQNVHHDIVAIPLIPANKEGLQFEVFGNFAAPSSQFLSNLSDDHVYSNFLANSTEFGSTTQDVTFGAGLSFNTGSSSKIKVIVSNEDIPGHGTSSALFAFETEF